MTSTQWHKLFFLLVGLTVMTACGHKQPTAAIDCEQVVDKRLLSIDFAKLTTETHARQWIKDVFAVNDSDITLDQYTTWQSLRWHSARGDYTFNILSSGPSVALNWSKDRQPSLEDVLACMGPPSHYQAAYEPGHSGLILGLALWYPHSGVVIDAVGYQGLLGAVPVVSPNLPVVLMWVTQPGSVQEVVLRWAVVDSGSAEYNKIVSSIKPWPGSLEEIVVEP